jgi:RecA-family ATPase
MSMSKSVSLQDALAMDDGMIPAESWDGAPVPERRWLVPHLIPRGAVTMLSGDGGVGKSLLAMQLMTAGVTAGHPGGGKWIGIEVPHFTSVGFFCEDDELELQRRQDALNAQLGIRFRDLAGMKMWPRVGRENVMVSYARESPPRISKTFRSVEQRVRDLKIELIVIDTVADVFGGNENYRAEVRDFIGRLRDLARINDGAVLLTAHPSVAGQQSGTGLSGSTAWNNSVRSRLYLTRPRNASDDEHDARELRGMKSNYGRSGGKIRLRYEAGVFVRDDSGTGMVAVIEARNLAKKFAELVAIANARKIDLSPKVSSTYAPNLIREMPEGKGLKRDALVKAMNDALADGLVRIEEEGRPSRRRQRLVKVSDVQTG